MYSGLRATLSVSFTEPLTIKRDNDQRENKIQNDVVEEAEAKPQVNINRYEWKSKGWSNCSQPCGSGNTYIILCQDFFMLSLRIINIVYMYKSSGVYLLIDSLYVDVIVIY